MSMARCAICEKIYDTDFQMEVDEMGNCICDNCFEEKAQECDCCGEDKVCSHPFVEGIGDTTICYDCSRGAR